MPTRGSTNTCAPKPAEARDPRTDAPPTTTPPTKPISRHIPERSVAQGSTGAKSNQTPIDAPLPPQPHFSFDDAVRLSGMVTEHSFNITGYTLGDAPSPLSKTDLTHAAKCFAKIIKDVSLTEDTPPFVVAGDVAFTVGFSSMDFDAAVLKDGKWIRINKTNSIISHSNLAAIESNVIDINRIHQWARRRDPQLSKMITFFLKGGGNYKNVFNQEGMTAKVSRGLSKEDIVMLLEADIITKRHARFAIPFFKVPKKNPEESRLITDGREVNERITVFEGEKMNLPILHTIMLWGSTHPIMLSIDANAYFFQFKPKGPPALWFPVRVAVEGRGDFECFTLNRLPMGFSLAPIIAQRTSNVVIQRCEERFLEERLDCKAAAWVDNFIIFATNDQDATRGMAILQDLLQQANIQCKGVDTSGEVVGLKRNEKGFQLLEDFRNRLKSDLEDILSAEHALDAKRLQQMAGKLMWLNYAILRRPLAEFPATLKLMRTLTTSQTVIKNHELQDELKQWKDNVDHTHKEGDRSQQNNKDVWVDATMTTIAVIIGNKVFIAKTDAKVAIIIMEAIAAGWGFTLAERKANLYSDNQCVAYAFAKGHCTSDAVNTIIANTHNGQTLIGSIIWVPTSHQKADGPTRGRLPHSHSWNLANLHSEWKIIKSTFIINSGNPSLYKREPYEEGL